MSLFSELRAQYRWKKLVHRNRSRHPDLIARERNGEDPTMIAEEMMTRDRDKMRAVEGPLDRVNYPDLWDYRYISYSLLDRIKNWVAARYLKRPE